jgi:hypothetical protein
VKRNGSGRTDAFPRYVSRFTFYSPRQPGIRSFRRLIERRKVLLPQPLGPMKATTEFFGTLKETFLIASNWP